MKRRFLNRRFLRANLGKACISLLVIACLMTAESRFSFLTGTAAGGWWGTDSDQKSSATQNTSAGRSYGEKEAENPAKNKGVFFKFPWAKKDEPAPEDPFGEAVHPNAAEIQAGNGVSQNNTPSGYGGTGYVAPGNGTPGYGPSEYYGSSDYAGGAGQYGAQNYGTPENRNSDYSQWVSPENPNPPGYPNQGNPQTGYGAAGYPQTGNVPPGMGTPNYDSQYYPQYTQYDQTPAAAGNNMSGYGAYENNAASASNMLPDRMPENFAPGGSPGSPYADNGMSGYGDYGNYGGNIPPGTGMTNNVPANNTPAYGAYGNSAYGNYGHENGLPGNPPSGGNLPNNGYSPDYASPYSSTGNNSVLTDAAGNRLSGNPPPGNQPPLASFPVGHPTGHPSGPQEGQVVVDLPVYSEEVSRTGGQNPPALAETPPREQGMYPHVGSTVVWHPEMKNDRTPGMEMGPGRGMAENPPGGGYRGEYTIDRGRGMAENPPGGNMADLRANSAALSGSEILVYEQGKPLAWVGPEIIMAADIMSDVDRDMIEFRDKIPPSETEQVREMFTRRALEQAIMRKLLSCDLVRAAPKERVAQFQEQLNKVYETSELPKAMQKAGCPTREAYETHLRQSGSSIAQQKKEFCETVFCQQAIAQHVPQDYEVSHAEMIDYYREHIKDFETMPRACWDELVVRKNRFMTRDEAYREIVRLGSLVVIQNVPFEHVAREFSDGATALGGGSNTWIRPGELMSKPLDEAIFTQPLGKISAKIIEDDTHFYIIRVTQREELSQTPFIEAQAGIKDKIKDQKYKEHFDAYMAKLRKEIPVTTIYDAIPTPEELRAKRQQDAQFSQTYGF